MRKNGLWPSLFSVAYKLRKAGGRGLKETTVGEKFYSGDTEI